MGAQEEVDYDQSEHSKIKCALSLVLLLALPPPRPRAPGLRPHTARQTLRAVPELTSTSSASCAGLCPSSSRGIVASRPSRCSSGRRPSRSRSASSASSGALKLARQAPATLWRRGTLTLVLPRSSFPPLWPLVIGYLTWVFLIDQAPMRGGRPQAWLRKSRVWEWFAGYYPVRCASLSPPLAAEPLLAGERKLTSPPWSFSKRSLIKVRRAHALLPQSTAGCVRVADAAQDVPADPLSLALQSADLPPDQRYVFGYHPHGVIGMGAIANFGTDATGFSRLFPGITPHLLTLASNFQLPLYRELLLGLGISSVSMKSCQNILRQGASRALPPLRSTRPSPG